MTGVADPQQPQENPVVFDNAKLMNLSHSLESVAITLPTFWIQNPDSWFVKVEAQLKAAKITSEETAYYKVLAVLPESAAIRVREISLKPNYEKGDYQRLKQKLILGSQPTPLDRLNRLCEYKAVSHKRPSDVLTDLECLFHSAQLHHVFPMTEFMKKLWWLRAMPPGIQQCLLPLIEVSPMEQLVAAANQMSASLASTSTLAAINAHAVTEFADEEEIDDYYNDETMIAAVHHRGKPSIRRDGQPTNRSTDQPLFCRYHAKFGNQAKRCAIGCSKYGKQSKN